MDLVQAHILSLESLQAGDQKVYSLGSEKGFSVLEVIRACEEVIGRKIDIQFESRRSGDPAVLVANSQQIRSKLGWKPHYPDLYTIVSHAWKWKLSEHLL